MAIKTTFGVENLLATSVVTASADIANVANLWDSFLTDFWQPGSGTQTLILDHGSTTPIDYWAIAGHNLGTDGANISIAWSDDDISYTLIETIAPSGDATIFSTFTSVSHRYTKITVIGIAPKIARINVGTTIDMNGTLSIPFVTPKNAGEYKLTTNETQNGSPKANNVKYVRTPVTMTFKNIPYAWVDANWDEIYTNIRTDLFFVLWDELNRPTETAVAWLTNDINPSWQSTLYKTITMNFNCKL